MITIFAQMLYALEKKQDMVLITITEEAGSAPRGVGSQMLVSEAGRLAGSVGGGAVEAQSIHLAGELLKEKSSRLHPFVLRPNPGEDIGMVCGGDVSVWFQYISCEDPCWNALIRQAAWLLENHQGGWFVQSLSGKAPALLDADGALLAGAAVPESAKTAHFPGCLQDEYFSMPLPVGERAIIFGAGHIAQALVPILRSVGFRPFVFDNRSDYAVQKFFPDAEQILCGDYDRIADYLTITPEDYIVVMTSGHSFDFQIQAQLLKQELAYIGVIGSHRKTAAVNAKLNEAGIPVQATDRVYTPIGTRIKAVTPAEIAVSIAGEMILVRAEHREESGGSSTHACPMHADR